MKSICIKSTREYAAGVIYNSCPVLCGYQVSAGTEHSFSECDINSIHVFLENDYTEHFRTVD